MSERSADEFEVNGGSPHESFLQPQEVESWEELADESTIDANSNPESEASPLDRPAVEDQGSVDMKSVEEPISGIESREEPGSLDEESGFQFHEEDGSSDQLAVESLDASSLGQDAAASPLSRPFVEDTAPVERETAEEPVSVAEVEPVVFTEEKDGKETSESSRPVLEDVAPAELNATSLEQDPEASSLPSGVVEDTAPSKLETCEEPVSAAEVEPVVFTEEKDGMETSESSRPVLEDHAPAKLDATSLEQDPEASTLPSRVVEDTAPLKLETGDEPVPATEQSSTEEEPMVGTDEKDEKELPNHAVDDQVFADMEAVEEPVSGTEHPSKAPVELETDEKDEKGLPSPAVDDQVFADMEAVEEPVSGTEHLSKAPVEVETVEEPDSANEHPSIQEEPEVVTEEAVDGKPDTGLDLKLISKEGYTAARDMVDKDEEGKGDWEEEEAEDDDDREEESATENARPLTAFANSEASTAPATRTPSLGGAGPSLPLRPDSLGLVVNEEAADGKPDVESELKLGSKEEHSAAKDMVDKEKEEGGWEEEEAEDDDDREDESATENAPPLAAFTNSKASTAAATDTPSLGGAGPSLPLRPAGLGRSATSLEPAPRAVQRSSGAAAPPASGANEDSRLNSDVSEGNKEAREKLQMIRVKFLRLAHRLGQSAHNVVVAQVLYRLGLAEQLRGGRSSSRTGAFSFERASILAEEQEAAGQDELEFGCTIMVLGKSGVGKSATINSIFDEVKSGTDAYSPATKRVQEITGTIHGIKLRVIDTPGLLPSFADQRHNEKVMSSVKCFIKKSPPDIVLYFDRLDMQSRDYGDLPLLRTITDTFGAAVWFNAIVVLTHASSAPPDGANGVPLSYEMFVAQRSHVVQQTIRQAAGDMRLMNPVSLVENHAACRTNRAGQRVLPNGQVWKPQLLLLCFASKILAEANFLLKLQDRSPGKPFGVRPRVPPLPFLLSSLLQSRAQLKLPDEQMGDDDVSDEDLDEEADSESEEEYDDLPPFRRLTKEELRLLDDEQRKNYFDELEYREKLFMKQQWKEERLRRREMRRRMSALSKEEFQHPDETLEDENVGAAGVAVPMPDMALPPSFDSDNPSHRYRYLEASQWLVRPVLETHGWDHDSGYSGLNIEKMFVISKKVPASLSGQITKDKKEANVQMECAASFKNGEGKVTLAGLDVQTIGKDLAYTLRSETWFNNFRRNKTTCGLAVTFFGDTVAAGMKLEDALMVGRRLKLVLNGGAITGRGDVAYGGSLEATLRDKDYPLVHTLSTLGLSVMDWHGDLAIGGNLQSQFMLGKTMMIARANLNNRGAGQISIRSSSSEQLQMALIGLFPLLRTFFGSQIFNSAQPMQ